MFGSEVLDVAIGLVFIYLVLSLISSAACELIESFIKGRAAYLKRGLKDMLNDPAGDGIVREIYNHPLVSSLFHGEYSLGRTGNLPSYIPPGNFALALMDIVGLWGPRATATPASPSSGLPPAPPPGAPVSPDWVRNTILASSAFSPHVSQALLTLADSAGYDRTKIRKSIEGWYNHSMDRVSGWFKRRSQYILLTIGLVLSLAINADTLSITNSLATDKALRTSLISAATEASKNPLPPGTGKSFEADIEQIRGTGLPLGWRNVPQSPLAWMIKILGIALTALAVSLGGPFWFDALNRIMVVRSAIKPGEKTPDAAPVAEGPSK